MANKKKERTLKVYSQSSYNNPTERPAIFLQGKWLEELGFLIGDHVAVKCSKNRIVITKSNEI